MVNLTKQDIQGVIDNAKNQMFQRFPSRQDLQSQNDLLRVILTTLQQCQQIVRQSEYQRAQMMRQVVAVEGRLVQMDQEMRLLQASITKLIESQPERVIMPVQSDGTQTPEQRYLYNPV